MGESADGGGLSRRQFAKGAVAGAALAAGGGGIFGAVDPAAGAAKPDIGGPSIGSGDLHLVNGKFVDHRGVVAKQLAIRDGRIAAVGNAKGGLGPGAQTINLKGRTVIPGLIDAHIHFARTGTNEGYEARFIETAFSHAELFQAIQERATTVPAGPVAAGGGVITIRGGWTPAQFVEGRQPNRAELNAAAPDHAVYLHQTAAAFGGVTNDLGAAFFEANGLTVDPVTGRVSSPNAAMAALQAIQTFEDKVRGTADIIAYMAANGATGTHDVTNLTVQPDDFAVMNALYHRNGGRLDIRQRWYRYMADATADELELYMDPMYREAGDDTYRLIGVGEQISNSIAGFEEGLRRVAMRQWRVQQHHGSPGTPAQAATAFHTVGMEFNVGDLRWSWGHAGTIGAEFMRMLKDVGVGVTLTRGPARAWIDSGVQTAAATDGTNVSWISPWMQIYFFVTRRNQQGQLVLDGQQISRLEALRLYTIGSAYFSREDHELGSFEAGKKADLAILNQDFLTVSDEQLRKTRSLLTLLGGRVVHAAGEFASLAPDRTQPFPDRFPESVQV
jgi:predicted amidohydrolase YtcJ